MNSFEKWSIWVSSTLTVLTGLGYFWTKYLVHNPDPFAVVNHPLEPWFLRIHIVVAPLLVFALGAVTVKHVWRHFVTRVPRGRKSGLVAAIMIAPMVLTGYLIQVTTNEGWLEALTISHIVFGVLYSVGLAAHNLFTKRGTAVHHGELSILGGTDTGRPGMPRAASRVRPPGARKVNTY